MTTHFKNPPEFITITCLHWKRILARDRFKNIITSSLSFLSKANRIIVHGFVVMPNHMHIVWRILENHKREDVQRDFLKFTSHEILKILKAENAVMLKALAVKNKDRQCQLWQRDSLTIQLWSARMMWQKINYIHLNPVRAGLCKEPWEYEYSSAAYYFVGVRNWEFVVDVREAF